MTKLIHKHHANFRKNLYLFILMQIFTIFYFLNSGILAFFEGVWKRVKLPAKHKKEISRAK